MLEKIRPETVFGTPLRRFRVADHVALDAALLTGAARLRTADGGVSKSNRGGWHSSGNHFEDEVRAFQQVRDAALQGISEATDAITKMLYPRTLRLKLWRG